MIRIGPAGSGLANIEGLRRVKKLGLTALEMEFTYGVWMKDDDARRMGELAAKLDIALSVHAPYYINLASSDRIKLAASVQRILASARTAHLLGARYVVFHPGFYQGRDPELVYDMIKKNVSKIIAEIKRNRWLTGIAPETMGRLSQFGTLDECLRLRDETGAGVCVDFSHILAREGSIDYKTIFDALKGVGHIHAHFSGIEYGLKGEKRHLVTRKKDVGPLIREAVKRRADITIINESPQPLKDSMMTLSVLKGHREVSLPGSER